MAKYSIPDPNRIVSIGFRNCLKKDIPLVKWNFKIADVGPFLCYLVITSLPMNSKLVQSGKISTLGNDNSLVSTFSMLD